MAVDGGGQVRASVHVRRIAQSKSVPGISISMKKLLFSYISVVKNILFFS